jgi:chaperonin GroEL (HSP60 family)
MTTRPAGSTSCVKILSPIRQIAENAGHDGAVISGNLLREDGESDFNAATDVCETSSSRRD